MLVILLISFSWIDPVVYPPGIVTRKVFWADIPLLLLSTSVRFVVLISAVRQTMRKISGETGSASFLLMKSGLQEHWQHRITKSTNHECPFQPNFSVDYLKFSKNLILLLSAKIFKITNPYKQIYRP